MRVNYKAGERLNFEVEGADQKVVFKQLATIQEVFDESKCGDCGSTDLRFVVRTVDDNDFYELHCKKCHAKMQYGQHKAGKTLFPKRKDDDGNWIGKNGWFKWVPPAKTEDK